MKEPEDDRPRGILFDMDGVLYNDDRLISGAAEVVKWVRGQSIPHLFVTNTSSKSCAALAEKLHAFGIRASDAEILTPSVAAADWLRANAEGEIALFVRLSARVEFAGLACVPDNAETGASYIVLGDLGETWDYRTLNRAFRLLYSNSAVRLANGAVATSADAVQPYPV